MGESKKKKGGGITTVLLILVLIIGLSLLLYPTVSDYINSLNQSNVISHYTEIVADMDDEECQRLIEAARKYNESIHDRDNVLVLSYEEEQLYKSLLNVSPDGAMGYIEIPSIKCTLPIHHGTSNIVLQTAIGHLEWTSLPVGGEGTHSVVSGHRGLPSAKLFTNLDKLEKGDIFIIRVLNEVMTYEVDQITIIRPDEVDVLKIEEGEDYCTLFTCTPYAINTHRLCVRGRRIDNIEESKKIHVTSEAMQIEPLLVAPIVAMPILLLLFVIASIANRRARR